MVPRGKEAAVAPTGAASHRTPMNGETYRFLRCGHILGSLLREILDDSFLGDRCPHPLTRVQFCLLKLISVNADLQASEVARYLGVSPAAVTKNVDKLERLGLVVRTACDQDRRVIRLSATDDGSRLVGEFEQLKADRVVPAVAGVTSGELAGLCELLERVCVSLYTSSDVQRGFCLRCAGYYAPDCPLGLTEDHCVLGAPETPSVSGEEKLA
jgi:DNA-binding MarR family transcriptional regulator